MCRTAAERRAGLPARRHAEWVLPTTAVSAQRGALEMRSRLRGGGMRADSQNTEKVNLPTECPQSVVGGLDAPSGDNVTPTSASL